jgi:diguanylate cyclase (GGDEF)-like protein
MNERDAGPIPEGAEKQGIVIVDDTTENLRLLAGILKDSGYKVRPAPNGARALATIRKEPPDLILLDIMMPEMDGYEVCRQLKADEQLRDIPVIFLSALNDVFDKLAAFKAGGVDYICKPFQMEEVLARVNTHLTIRAQQKTLLSQNAELKKKNRLIEEQAKELQLLASRDTLTGLSNRRDFLEKAKREETHFKRAKRAFSLVLLDIDHFKNINDTYGHECGDAVLARVAREIEGALREQDIVARWGGEEFICLLPETGLDGSEHVAGKVRLAIADNGCRYGGSLITVTATLGVSLYDGSSSLEECIRRADEALYQGKNQGRNRVVVHEAAR